jgi:ADP-heptose:LPS heptosyltransferase
MIVPPPASILIMRLGAIGDCLRVLPALKVLKDQFPMARIGWAVEHWVAPLLAEVAGPIRLHVLNRKALRGSWRSAWWESRRFLSEVRAENYDVVLDFHGRLKSGFLGWQSGIPWRIGYGAGQVSEGNHWFSNVQVRLKDPLENRVLRFLHLLEPLGLAATLNEGFTPEQSGVYLPPVAQEEARRWYDQVGNPALAAYPGCSAHQAAYHRWPLEKWVALLNRLHEHHVPVALFWGPDERPFVEEIHARAPHTLLAPPTSLLEMMALLAQFQLYLGTNSAALHMSWLQGVPCVFFSGPADPRTDGPLQGVAGQGLRAEQHLRPGKSKRLQPLVTQDVAVDTAVQAVLAQLKSKRENPPPGQRADQPTANQEHK